MLPSSEPSLQLILGNIGTPLAKAALRETAHAACRVTNNAISMSSRASFQKVSKSCVGVCHGRSAYKVTAAPT